MYISLQKRTLKLIHSFLIIKAKLPATRALHHQEKKKMNEKFVMHQIKFTLVQDYFLFAGEW